MTKARNLANLSSVGVGDGGFTTNDFTNADHSKLDGIETSATADQTGAEIKALYQAESNAFTDTLKAKLDGVEASATSDQTDAEIKTAVENATDITLGGSPTTTTQSSSDNSTKVATTAYVTTAVGNVDLSTKASLSGDTFTGDISIPDKLIHAGDTNTSIRFPSADTVTVETGGSERMRITSAGNVGIGNNNPEAYGTLIDNLVVGTTSGENGMTIASGTANGGRICFADNTTSPQRGMIEYSHGDDSMSLNANGSTKLKLASAGQIGIGGANYGTAGQVLTSAGVSSPAVWSSPAAGGSWTHIATADIGATFTTTSLSLTNVFSSAYDFYFLKTNHLGANDPCEAYFRIIDSNGIKNDGYTMRKRNSESNATDYANKHTTGDYAGIGYADINGWGGSSQCMYWIHMKSSSVSDHFKMQWQGWHSRGYGSMSSGNLQSSLWWVSGEVRFQGGGGSSTPYTGTPTGVNLNVATSNRYLQQYSGMSIWGITK